MPFPYRYICDLLQQLDDEVRKSPGKQAPSEAIIQSWFQHHRSLIHEPGNDACAMLSMLLPERRTDRVYNIQAPRLQSIFGKALLLGASRVLELRRWTESGSGVDLGDCVESVLRRTPNSRDDTTHLTVEEIDEALSRIAAACKFSSPAVRALHQTSNVHDPNSLLTDIYTRLGSRDAKWFTRLVLKNYQPVALNAHVVFRNYHPLLPQMMKIRDDLTVAAAYVRHIDEKSDAPSTIANYLKPHLGTKVGRQPWFKARSMRNCIDMAQGRDVICEMKMDGEYCQIHIDLRRPRDCIQIFSKSGKDSTTDRIGLHKSIRDSLKVGSEDCPFTKGCILEGELVVYSTKEHRILPFHKIRKHVSRSGSFLGTANDSQAHDHEHLMIIYYDVLLIDDESLLGVKNSERFRRLSEMVTCREGYAELVTRSTICTSRPSAVLALRELFAQCISLRGEGLVLKPDEPYFDFATTYRRYGCCNIKLKKEYIKGWGDVGDFAVVGASYDAAKAREYRLPNIKWTHFFIGCLENKDQARAKTEIPRFRVTNIVELTGPTLSAFWTQRSPISVPYNENTLIQLDGSGRVLAKKPTVIFPDPLVFDMRCFGFDKEPNTKFWSMRFPQVEKVHHDRSYLDTITFSELQEIAETATNVPDEEDSQEMKEWVKALEKLDRGKFMIDDLSQASSCSDPDPSPSSTASSQPTPRQSRHNLPTPPRSSAVAHPVASVESDSTSSTTPLATYGKRRVTERSGSSHATKRRRTQSGMSSVDSSQQSTPTDSLFGHRHREPLSQLDPNTSERQRTGHECLAIDTSISTPSGSGDTDLPAEKPPVSSPAAYYTASEMVSSSPSRATMTRQSSVTARSQSKVNRTYPTCCSIAAHRCALASCSILLSPCISSYAWITEDLLKRHGIVDPLLDPRVWNNKDLFASMCGSPGSLEDGSIPTSTPAGRRHIRKICLVESKRKEATKAFLQKIKDTDLRKRDGEREWITVYDWRVLEFITEQEEQEKSSKGTDPWRRFYVGIV
ncbi:hypothetical protein F4803DRAFT_513248 [Xylaria telfairii]|nr:hypothetical protein F4803DRAFT_513248 [Xylaria telfairii]